MPQNHGLWEEYILSTGNKIAFFRKFKKISLKTLAAKISIPYRQSNWESKLNQLAQANNREFKKAFE